MSGGHDRSLCYFAYGSNLHAPQMASLAPSAVAVGLARLPGWELFVTDHGVLSIRPVGGRGEVLGLVWSCTDADFEVLDRFEAVDEGLYVREEVMVVPYGPGTVGAPPGAGGPCHVYRSVSTATGRPRTGYLEGSVLPPMHSLGLPGAYVQAVERWIASGTVGPVWTPVPAPGTVFSRLPSDGGAAS